MFLKPWTFSRQLPSREHVQGTGRSLQRLQKYVCSLPGGGWGWTRRSVLYMSGKLVTFSLGERLSEEFGFFLPLFFPYPMSWGFEHHAGKDGTRGPLPGPQSQWGSFPVLTTEDRLSCRASVHILCPAEKLHSVPSSWVFVMNWYWILSIAFFASSHMIIEFFFSLWMGYINWVSDVEPALCTWDKSHLVVVCNFLCIVAFDLVIFCWVFCICVHERDWSVVFLCCLWCHGDAGQPFRKGS